MEARFTISNETIYSIQDVYLIDLDYRLILKMIISAYQIAGGCCFIENLHYLNEQTYNIWLIIYMIYHIFRFHET